MHAAGVGQRAHHCTESRSPTEATLPNLTCGMDLSYTDASEPTLSETSSDPPSFESEGFLSSSFSESEGANFSPPSSESEAEVEGDSSASQSSESEVQEKSSASRSSESEVEGGSYFSHFQSGSEGGCSSSTRSDGSPRLTSSSFEAHGNPLNSERLKAASEKTLYEGAQISILLSYLLIFQFVINHSLSGKAFTELLQLLSIHLPRDAKLPSSAQKLKSFFADLFPDVTPVTYGYCSQCLALLPSPLSTCLREVCDDAKTEQFVTLPLQSQLQRKFEDPETWNLLQLRFQHNCRSGILEDIYDGREYVKHKDFLGQPENVSLSCNTDGVALFRSSTTSLWPVWLAVNELPKEVRFLRKHMILAAMWFSRTKPLMSTFMRPVLDAVNSIYTNGILVKTPVGIKTARAMLLQLSVDLPARALVLNMKHFNGAFACCYCESEGETLPGDHLHRYWPYISGTTQRTHQSLLANARKAVAEKTSIKGVKGASVLCIHQPFNLVKGTVIDGLHSIFIGVVKQLLKLWTDKANRGKDYYIGNKVALCDKRLLKIKVPDRISRVPRSIDDLAHWKASEKRSWIFFYCLPVLSGILDEPYFGHLVLLVAALHILWSDHITLTDLDRAELYITNFYVKCRELYGVTSLTMNVHLLSHMCTCVADWGPMWGYSCFPFESMNHELKLLFHGSRDMSKQMAFTYVMNQVLPYVPNVMLKSQSRCVQTFADKMRGRTSFRKKLLDKENGASAVGGISLMSPSPTVVRMLNAYFHRSRMHESILFGDKVQTFYRLLFKKELYYSSKYARVKKRNSFTIMYQIENGHNKYGLIYYFVYICNVPLVIVMDLIPAQRCFILPDGHGVPIIPVSIGALTIINVNSIVEKCVFVEFDHVMYVIPFPCKFLSD